MDVINSYTDHPIAGHSDVVDQSTQLLDVRQPEEFATGSLPGAVNIPLDQLPAHVARLDASRRIVVFCRSGGRSAQAAALFADVGFGDIVNLNGGMLALEDAR